MHSIFKSDDDEVEDAEEPAAPAPAKAAAAPKRGAVAPQAGKAEAKKTVKVEAEIAQVAFALVLCGRPILDLVSPVSLSVLCRCPNVKRQH